MRARKRVLDRESIRIDPQPFMMRFARPPEKEGLSGRGSRRALTYATRLVVHVELAIAGLHRARIDGEEQVPAVLR